ncbi:MAG: LuxR C-terminal-related transcriptional regulator [Sporichthyaceae bacterium]
MAILSQVPLSQVPLSQVPARRARGERCLTLAPSTAPLTPLGDEQTSDQLSLRERQILRLVGQGATTVKISELLGLSSTTVDSHIRAAAEKLGAANRTEAAVLAAESGTNLSTVEVAQDQRRLLELLAVGYSVAQAARQCHLSARTAQRRIAEARRSLGAPTNRAAVVELARLNLPTRTAS